MQTRIWFVEVSVMPKGENAYWQRIPGEYITELDAREAARINGEHPWRVRWEAKTVAQLSAY